MSDETLASEHQRKRRCLSFYIEVKEFNIQVSFIWFKICLSFQTKRHRRHGLVAHSAVKRRHLGPQFVTHRRPPQLRRPPQFGGRRALPKGQRGIQNQGQRLDAQICEEKVNVWNRSAFNRRLVFLPIPKIWITVKQPMDHEWWYEILSLKPEFDILTGCIRIEFPFRILTS